MKNKINREIFDNWNFEVNFLGYEKMFKASVMVPIVIINNELNILFQLRSKNIKQGGEVSFPGGKFDSNDCSFWHTALRETCEELGLSEDKVELKAELDTLVSPFNSLIKAFIGFLNIKNIDDLSLNRDEVEKVFTVPLKWFYENEVEVYNIYVESKPFKLDENGNKILTFPAKALDLPVIYHDAWSNSKREIYLYNYNNYKIWGFTAAILKDALKKLEILGIKDYLK